MLKENKAMSNRLQLAWALVMAVVCVALRILPHAPNVSPMLALALFTPAFLGQNRLALIYPLAVQLLGDCALVAITGETQYIFHDTFFSVYGTFLAIALAGWFFARNVSPVRTLGFAAVSSLVFFLVTNFFSWLTLDMYAKTPAGLLEAYTLGVPFHKWAFAADIGFAFAFFAMHRVIVGQKTREAYALPLAKCISPRFASV
jgi:hypothetical protein